MYRGWGGSCGCGCGGRWGRGRENCGGTGCGFCFASFASFRFVSFCFSFRIDSFFVSFCLTFCFAPFLVTVSVSVLVVYRVAFRSPFRVLLQSFRFVFSFHAVFCFSSQFASFRFLVQPVSFRFVFLSRFTLRFGGCAYWRAGERGACVGHAGVGGGCRTQRCNGVEEVLSQG